MLSVHCRKQVGLTTFFLLKTLLLPGILQANPLSLTEAEQRALAADPVLKAWDAQAESFSEQAIAEESWPDPKVSFGSMNLPGDDLNPAEQGMLELKVEQMLPRGDSNHIKRRKSELQADSADTAKQLRKKEVLREVRLAWLDVWYWQQVTEQLESERYLFESLRTVTESMYRQGKKDQQDLLSAELELSRLEDRLVSFKTSQQQSLSRLNRWLEESVVDGVYETLPASRSPQAPTEKMLSLHPRVAMEALAIEQSEQDVAMAESAYSAQWGVEVKYGRQMSDMNSMSMSDSKDQYSLMLMVDVPLFTGNRQDRALSASQYRKEASINRRLDVLRQLHGEANMEVARYEGLKKRLGIYREKLIPQVDSRSEAARKAYQADARDFASVVQAAIARLNTHIEYQRLQADLLQSEARLSFLLPEDQLPEEGK